MPFSYLSNGSDVGTPLQSHSTIGGALSFNPTPYSYGQDQRAIWQDPKGGYGSTVTMQDLMTSGFKPPPGFQLPPGMADQLRSQMSPTDYQNLRDRIGSSVLPGEASPFSGPNGPAANGSSSSLSFGPNSSATAFYNDVLTGKQLPFDQTTKDSMLSDASDMTAAAESAQRQQMINTAAASGASATDPSLKGSENEAAAARQAGNVKAKQGIESQANQANFAAKAGAASHMMDYDLQQQAFQNNWAKTALGFLPMGGGGGGSRQGGGVGGRMKGQNEGFLGFGKDPSSRFNQRQQQEDDQRREWQAKQDRRQQALEDARYGYQMRKYTGGYQAGSGDTEQNDAYGD